MCLNVPFVEGKNVHRVSDGMVGRICSVIPKYLYGEEYLSDVEIHVQFGAEEVSFLLLDAFELLRLTEENLSSPVLIGPFDPGISRLSFPRNQTLSPF